MKRTNTHVALMTATAAVFLWSAIEPVDRLTWVLEVFPAVIAAPVVVWLWNRRPPGRIRFTTLVYTLMALHAMILMVGGHYSYARVPVFEWIKDHYHLDRNYYDRLGHFAQGFVPAMIAREILLRRTGLERGTMLTFLVICICMAISAWYELVEFAAAKTLGGSAESFLGTQGDVWDTQWDMTWCFIGAIGSMALMPRWQDRQIERLSPDA